MTTSDIPQHCWLTNAAEVRASVIEGCGLFAMHDIEAGEPVMQLGGPIIDNAALARLTPPYSSLCVGIDQNILIDPAHPVRYGNHCCDPNLWHENATTIVARRRIRANEELTIDYATHTINPQWSMACHCRSGLCRQVVTGDDWRLADLQARYGRHWTPPLLDAITADTSKGLGPFACLNAVVGETAMRREASQLIAHLSRDFRYLSDMGLSLEGMRRDIDSAGRTNSPLRVYLERILARLRTIFGRDKR